MNTGLSSCRARQQAAMIPAAVSYILGQFSPTLPLLFKWEKQQSSQKLNSQQDVYLINTVELVFS